MDICNYIKRIGCKLYKYVEGMDEPEILRIYKVDEVKKVIQLFNKDRKKVTKTLEELESEYRQLAPDGVVNVSIVKNNTVSDVVVTLGRLIGPVQDNDYPYAVCRQLIYDVFTNYANSADENTVYAGMSISKDTCPAEVEFKDVLVCDKLVESRAVYVYLDDTLDDLLAIIPSKKYDAVLRNIELLSKSTDLGTFEPGVRALGFAKSFRELLVSNKFMYDFRRAFGIFDVPYEISEEYESLYEPNIIFIEKQLHVNILETYLVRYTRELDLGSIKRDYMLVSSDKEDNKKIYIVAFDKAIGDYVPRDTLT